MADLQNWCYRFYLETDPSLVIQAQFFGANICFNPISYVFFDTPFNIIFRLSRTEILW